MSQPELAERLDVAVGTIGRWESEAKPPSARIEGVSEWLAEEVPESLDRILERARISKETREHRQALGTGLNEAGRRLGVDPRTVSDWEAGKFMSRHINAKRVADWLAEPLPAKSCNEMARETVLQLKERRQALSWSRARLVRRLGVGKSRVADWENGKVPSPSSLRKIEE